MTAINGVSIPNIGFGTFVENLDDNKQIENIVFAINCGYRFLDTAWSYGNENLVGRAIFKATKGG